MVNQNAIDIKNFSFWYGKKQALSDINLHIPKGQISAIMGPSGCGKSTLLRSINRMNDLIPDTKSSGQILFDGNDIYKSGKNIFKLRTRIGMVFQRPNPFPMSIYDNIAYGPKLHKMCKGSELDDRVEWSLKAVNLWNEVSERLKTSAFELSGGQQQRLCMARTLAVQPEIILLDEPTSALDPVSAAKIEEQLEEFIGKYTIIIVTHNIAQAARVSKYACFMMLGKVADFGKTTELFTNPKNEITEKYLTGKFG